MWNGSTSNCGLTYRTNADWVAARVVMNGVSDLRVVLFSGLIAE